MSEYAGTRVIEESKAAAWKSWEGRAVNEEFRLRDYLGGSSHSAVFLTDLYDRDHHTAAIKLALGDSPAAASLLASCDLAAGLSHPNLLHVLTAGRAQIDGTDVAYAVMEFAEENLGQVVSQRPLMADEARDMLKPALEALSYLHAQGFAHGRIHPANIMAAGDQLKLSADAVRRNGERLTDATPYNPPEGVASETGDSWSLGMALVEILTQAAPQWNREAAADPVVPDTIAAPFDEIVRHCLRRDPKLRWTAADIAYHLDPEAAPKRTFQAELAARAPAPESEPASASASASYSSTGAAATTIAGGAKRRSFTTYLIPAVLLCVALAGLVLWLSRGSNSQPPATPSAAENVSTPAAPPAHATPPPSITPKPVQPKAGQAKPKPPLAKPVQPKPVPTGGAVSSSAAVPEAPITPAVSAPKPAESEPATALSTANGDSPPAAAASSPAPSASASALSAARGVVHEVTPEPSQKALDTIRGSVRVSVRVDIDAAGSVKYAKLDSSGPSAYFANQALRAAQEWKFAPTGHPSQQFIHFVFTSSGVSGSTTAE